MTTNNRDTVLAMVSCGLRGAWSDTFRNFYIINLLSGQGLLTHMNYAPLLRQDQQYTQPPLLDSPLQGYCNSQMVALAILTFSSTPGDKNIESLPDRLRIIKTSTRKAWQRPPLVLYRQLQ